MDKLAYYKLFKELGGDFRYWFIDFIDNDEGHITDYFRQITKNELFTVLCALAHAIIDDGDEIQMENIIKKVLREERGNDENDDRK